jgi:hypothetical protein
VKNEKRGKKKRKEEKKKQKRKKKEKKRKKKKKKEEKKWDNGRTEEPKQPGREVARHSVITVMLTPTMTE